ncbi:MAG: UDP-N-acetylmuramoyl-L-alanyl-D-glutamate--2,6-diaminopimelate ligase [Coriobacteriales bacterium]|jgi:UDP-N-acetylmuramoyl-L-alanyl-D-glutamate--2,6-diaminopimelate ligase|nr:UDP-N-acetylmuramoyl-L-alanyl-D-glutamate--2,6-diaminopimelate ligase [Coriobacteriales bacterium]
MSRPYKGICIDSRKAQPGWAFVAIRGFEHDGHDFVDDAIAHGASTVVVDHPLDLPERIEQVVVADTAKALAELAADFYGHPAEQLTLIGVTGTKGKTTTVHMIAACLEQAGRQVAMIGTNGVEFGGRRIKLANTTPDALTINTYLRQMVDAGVEVCAMEVSSQALKLDRVYGLTFDYALFLNLSEDHISPAEHPDFADYQRCKAKLFRQCKCQIINADDPHAQAMVNSELPLLTFGASGKDLRLRQTKPLWQQAYLGVQVETDWGSYAVGLPGHFNAMNALACQLTCAQFGVAITTQLAQFKVAGRTELLPGPKDYLVLLDYAHNALSLENLLSTLREYRPGRLICVFGAGGDRARDRRAPQGEVAARLADLALITADNPRFEAVADIDADIIAGFEAAQADGAQGRYREIRDRAEAIRFVLEHAHPRDIIAICGKGDEDYLEVCGKRSHYSDRETVAAFFA